MKRPKFETLLIIFGIVEAIHLRNYFKGRISNDFIHSTKLWYDYIQGHGFFNAFKDTFSDYTPLYLHFIALITFVPVSELLAIKLISFFFEIVMVVFIYKILRLLNQSHMRALKAVVVILLCPTVILNGAYWGQSDVVYVSMIIAAIYFLFKKDFFISFIWLGFSFATKLQCVFIFPLFMIFTLQNKSLLKYWLVIPCIYFLTILPSLLAGRGIVDLLLIYFHQAKDFDPLSLYSPTVYPLFPDSSESYHDMLSRAGIYFTGIISLVTVLFIVKKIKSISITSELTITMALLFSLLVPYFLPHMHERYFFLADILSVLYIFVCRKNYFLPVIIIGASTICYYKYLLWFYFLPLPHLSFLMLVALIVMYRELIFLLRKPEYAESPLLS